ncbi:MAG: twin-arginine translocation signal domain-containing protein [Terriglobales bacterium]
MKNRSPASKLIAALSRRSFFGRAAVGGGAILLGSSIPKRVWAQDEGLPGVCDFPVPIPHINTPPGAHFYFAGPVDGSAVATDGSGAHPEGRDPSVIFNFKGFVGQADLNLSGTGTDLTTGESGPYTFHTDMRFMRGVFVGTDLVERSASFAFV